MVTNKDLIMVAVLLGVAWYLKKKVADAGAVATDAAKWIAEAANTTWDASSNAANTAATAVVFPLGDALGVPRTNMTECDRAKAEGRTLDASFACPALDFIKYLGR